MAGVALDMTGLTLVLAFFVMAGLTLLMDPFVWLM